MKKTIAVLLTLAMALCLLTACGSDTGSTTAVPGTSAQSGTNASAAKWPAGKNVRYIMTASAGGGLDICARILQPYWEKAIGDGTTVTVENLTGGANWNGWNEMFKATPDGMTVSNIHTPQVFSYLNKSLQNTNNLDSFNLLCNCVTDSVTFVIRKDDSRFADVNDLKDLVDYLKATDKEFLVALTSKGGADELAMLELMDQTGLKNLVGINHSDGISAQKASFLSKDCDIYIGKVGDTLPMFNDGTVKVLAVCKNSRSLSFPDVATAKE